MNMTEEQTRAAFEAWLNPGNHAGNVSPWVAPGRYEKEAHQLAWLAWRAASQRPSPDRMREALEQIAQHFSSDWPERCQTNVLAARHALTGGA